jgi:hypothetical protein
MLRKVFFVLITAFIIFGCAQPADEIIKEVTTINNIPIIWKGSLPYAPSNPSVGWAYYDTAQKTAFIWDGNRWDILAQDGVSIIWKGELPSAPSNPKLNWAYYNIIDGNSYIYNGSNWDLLAKAGRDGASGILLWIGSLPYAPSNPQAGWAYHNSADGVSYIYDGANWEVLVRDGIVWKGVLSSAPYNPQINWAYFDTTTVKSYIWDGSSWQIMAESNNANITVPVTWKGSLTSAPFNPQIGWMYYNSVLGKSYIWDGISWNIVAQDGNYPEGFLMTWKGELMAAPSSPQKGWAYYDTSEKKSYIWDSGTWQILAQDGADGSGSGGTQGPWLYVLFYTKEGNYQQYNQTTLSTANFGKIGIGGSISTTTFYITLNGGTSNTTFNLTGPITVTGQDADCFSVIQPSTTSTTAGTYITGSSVIFTPNSIGEKTATITIPNDSPDKPDFSFTVTGEGGLFPKIFDGGEGDGDDQITCSVIDSQGNIYFIGYGYELVNHHSGSDWWIKKIDSYGNEITSGWNKKIDLNENTSTAYDRPKNAVIDGNDNLYVSDDYFTMKFNSDGTELWRKNTGGTLYLSQYNLFIVTSSKIIKYDSFGTELWTKDYAGKLAVDNSGNVAVFPLNTSSTVLRYISSDGTEKWSRSLSNINVDNDWTWYNGSFSSSGGVANYEFDVTYGNTYYIYWNQQSYGDGNKTAYILVGAYWKGEGNNYGDAYYYGTAIFSPGSSMENGYTTPKSFIANKDGKIIVRVEPLVTGLTGTYAVNCTTTRLATMNINDAVFDYSGNLYVAGYGTNIFNSYSKRDVWIKKFDSLGNEFILGWNKKYDWGHSDDESATKIYLDGTNIIVIGQGDDLINGASKNNTWVKKFSTDGTDIYSFVIPESNTNNSATLLKIDYEGNYYFSSGSSTAALLRKYNSAGVLQNSYSLNTKTPYVFPPMFIMDNSYNVYMYGYYPNIATSVSGNDWFIRKFDNMGIEQ